MFALGPVGNQSKHQIEQNQVLFIMPIEELFLKPFLSGKTFIKKKKKKKTDVEMDLGQSPRQGIIRQIVIKFNLEINLE
jgi:hypothetical protein